MRKDNWKIYWSYKIPIMEAELNGETKPNRPHDPLELEVYMICAYHMLHDRFYNKRSESRTSLLPLEYQYGR